MSITNRSQRRFMLMMINDWRKEMMY